MNRNRNILTATALTLSLAAAGCGSAKSPAPDTLSDTAWPNVPLNIEKSPRRQARQIQAVLNAGDRITGATVEFGSELRVKPGQIAKEAGKHITKIEQPIRLGKGIYGYMTEPGPHGWGVVLHVIKSSAANLEPDFSVTAPRAATLESVVASSNNRYGEVESEYFGIAVNEKSSQDYSDVIGYPLTSWGEPPINFDDGSINPDTINTGTIDFDAFGGTP